MPPFFPCIARATVAGFDRIARAYKSVTRKQPHIRHRTGVFEQCALISSPSSSDLSAAFASVPALLLRARLTGNDGEGEDGGPGAREEGDGEGEGKGDQSRRVFFEGWPAARLDPGRLDRSTIRQADLDDLADGGLIPHGSARLPGKESEPQP